MKKKEMREVTITYCDYCGKELRGNHSSIEYTDGRKLDFCSTYTSKITKTCLDKHREAELKENKL